MADATIVIDIKGDVEGGKVVVRTLTDIDKAQAKVKNGNKELENQFKLTNSAADYLKNSLKGLAAAYGIRELGQILDTYTNIQNRLKLVTSGTADLANTTKILFEIANQTRQSFAATAEVYTRVALATKELGLTQQQTLQFSKSLNQAVVLSGASAAEASAGLIQLSQGLASGTLRGDELRSVLEQLPMVADVIAKSLGVTRGELRKMGEDGKITAGTIIRAFAEARGELDGKFAKTVSTIGQAFTLLRNRVTELIGELDKTSGAANTIAWTIIKSADVISIFVHEITAAFQFTTGVLQSLSGTIMLIVNTTVKGIESIINTGIKGLNYFKSNGSQIPQVNFSSALPSVDSYYKAAEESFKGAGSSLKKSGEDFGRLSGLGTPPTQALKETNEQLNITEKAVAGVDDGMKRLMKQTDQFARSAADAFGDFVSGAKTGKEALLDLVGSMQKMLLQETITNPLSDMLRGAIKGGSGSGLGALGSSLSSAAGSMFGSIGNGIKSFFGFDSGGSMTLGGTGGIDQNILSLNGAPIAKTSRGETLSISPGANGGGGGVTVNQTFNLSMGVAAAVAAEFSSYLPKIQESTRAAINESNARGIR